MLLPLLLGRAKVVFGLLFVLPTGLIVVLIAALNLILMLVLSTRFVMVRWLELEMMEVHTLKSLGLLERVSLVGLVGDIFMVFLHKFKGRSIRVIIETLDLHNSIVGEQ